MAEVKRNSGHWSLSRISFARFRDILAFLARDNLFGDIQADANVP